MSASLPEMVSVALPLLPALIVAAPDRRHRQGAVLDRDWLLARLPSTSVTLTRCRP